MPIVALPDITGALVARLRSIPDITALTSTRISSELQNSWEPMPRHCILISGPVGSPGDDYMIGIQRTRFDFLFWGSTGFEAMRLYRTAHPFICPRQDSIMQFRQSGVSVVNVQKEGGPTRLDDPDTHWPRVLATYVFWWSEFPV